MVYDKKKRDSNVLSWGMEAYTCRVKVLIIDNRIGPRTSLLTSVSIFKTVKEIGAMWDMAYFCQEKNQSFCNSTDPLDPVIQNNLQT